MKLSRFICDALDNSTAVVQVFERMAAAGRRGETVFDFALGQPSEDHSEAVQLALTTTIADSRARLHPYPPTHGIPEARQAVAAHLSDGARRVHADDVMLTAGAAGALHVILRTLLEPGDEVVTPAPYFLEYKTFCENYRLKLRVASTRRLDVLDVDAIEATLTARTKLLLLNSPNNPAGTAYGSGELTALSRVLQRFHDAHGHALIVASDETYRRLHYGPDVPASPWLELPNSLLIGSFSKDLGLAGERIGYLAVSPTLRSPALLQALAFGQRALGFFNAPLIWQRALPHCLHLPIDVTPYRKKRDAMAELLIASGLDFHLPEAGMFFLIRSPTQDAGAFVELLARQRVLVLPGDCYGAPHYVRASFSVDPAVIAASLGSWQAAVYEALELGVQQSHAFREDELGEVR